MSATIYLDTSAILKRALPEAQSTVFVGSIERAVRDEGVLVTSSLTRVEVSRALRRRETDLSTDVDRSTREALQSIALAQITDVVIEFARTIGPPALRSLDAIHLATAVALGVHELWTYDTRLGDAAAEAGIAVRMPA